jgi:hypothetical protein
VAAYGRVEEVARDGAAWDGALAIVARYVEDAEAYLAKRRDQPRVLLRVKPERMVTWAVGGGGGKVRGRRSEGRRRTTENGERRQTTENRRQRFRTADSRQQTAKSRTRVGVA